MCQQARNLDRPDDAVKLAEAALRGYRGSSPRLSARLHSELARSHAAAGDMTECRAAIDAAIDAFEGAPSGSGDPDWIYWMSECSLHELVGSAYLKLGENSAACEHLELSLASGATGTDGMAGADQATRADQATGAGAETGVVDDAAYARDTVARLIILAKANATRSEPEQACEAGNRAIALLSGQVSSARLTKRVGEIRRELRFYRNVPEVREFGERVADLITSRSR